MVKYNKFEDGGNTTSAALNTALTAAPAIYGNTIGAINNLKSQSSVLANKGGNTLQRADQGSMQGLLNSFRNKGVINNASYKDFAMSKSDSRKSFWSGVAKSTATGASLGTTINPGWGTLIGTAAGLIQGIGHGIAAKILHKRKAQNEADKFNRKVNIMNAMNNADFSNAAANVNAMNQRAYMQGNSLSNLGAYGGALGYESSNALNAINTLGELNKTKIGTMPNSFMKPNEFAEGGMPMQEGMGLPMNPEISEYNAGGTHEENPNGGIFIGMGQNGKPNMVEEGEVKVDDYVFSNRLNIPPFLKKKFGLSPRKNVTFAEGVKKILKQYKDRPNDPIANNSKNAFLEAMQQSQETERQKKEWNDIAQQADELGISPQQLLQQQQQQEQMQQMQALQAQQQQQPSPEEMQAMQQQMVPQGMEQPLPEEGSMPEGMTQDEIIQAIREQGTEAGMPINENAYGGDINRFDGGSWVNPYATPTYGYSNTLGGAKAVAYPNSYQEDGFTGVGVYPNLDQTPNTNTDVSHLYDFNHVKFKDPIGTLRNAKLPSADVIDTEIQNLENDIAAADAADEKAFNQSPLDSLDLGLKEDSLDLDPKETTNPNSRYPTWMRYAPVAGSAIGTIMALRRPDYSGVNRIIKAADDAAQPIQSRNIGGYQSANPLDTMYYAHENQANVAAAIRGLRNNAGNNRAVANSQALQAMYNGMIADGKLQRQAAEYNAADRNNVARHNLDIDRFNTTNALEVAAKNQNALAHRVGAYQAAENLRSTIDANRQNAINANLSNLFNSLGNIGSENYDRNMILQNQELYGFNPYQRADQSDRMYREYIKKHYDSLPTQSAKDKFLQQNPYFKDIVENG